MLCKKVEYEDNFDTNCRHIQYNSNVFQTNSNKQKQKLPYIVTIIDTIKTFYLLFSLISSFSFYRANYSHAMDLDLESRKKDHSTSTYLCNPNRDRETGSKGKYVHRDCDRRTRGRSVFTSTTCFLMAIHSARKATVLATWITCCCVLNVTQDARYLLCVR